MGVATAERDSGIREAECEQAAKEVQYSTDTQIASNTKLFSVQKAAFKKEVSRRIVSWVLMLYAQVETAKAETNNAYELRAKTLQQVGGGFYNGTICGKAERVAR